MAEDAASVKIKTSTLELMREWADGTGRSVSGLVDQILRDAWMHYQDGRKAYARELAQRAETVGLPLAEVKELRQ